MHPFVESILPQSIIGNLAWGNLFVTIVVLLFVVGFAGLFELVIVFVERIKEEIRIYRVYLQAQSMRRRGSRRDRDDDL